MTYLMIALGILSVVYIYFECKNYYIYRTKLNIFNNRKRIYTYDEEYSQETYELAFNYSRFETVKSICNNFKKILDEDSLHEISRSNIEDMLGVWTYGKVYHDCSSLQRDSLDRLVNRYEETLGFEFKKESTVWYEYLSPGSGEYEVYYRFLLIEWIFIIFSYGYVVYKTMQGAELLKKEKTWYLLFKTKSKDKKMPVCICHGMGVGPASCDGIINYFLQDRDVLCPIIANISHAYHVDFNDDDYMTKRDNEIMETIKEFLAGCGYNKMNVIGQSYGTGVITTFYKRMPELINKIAYIDPINCMPARWRTLKFVVMTPYEMAKKYSFGQYSKGNIVYDTLFFCFLYFISLNLFKNIDTVIDLGRNTNISDVSLTKRHITKDVMFMLGGSDFVIPSSIIKKYIEKNILDATIHIEDDYLHAYFLLYYKETNKIISDFFESDKAPEISN